MMTVTEWFRDSRAGAVRCAAPAAVTAWSRVIPTTAAISSVQKSALTAAAQDTAGARRGGATCSIRVGRSADAPLAVSG
jgi:hypothetical protein